MALALDLDPAMIQANLRPHESRTFTVRISNPSSEKIRLTVESDCWSPGRLPGPSEQWLQLTPHQMVLGPGQTEDLQIKTVFPDPLEGEVVMMVYLVPEIKPGQLSIKTRMGFPVYLRKNATVEKKAAITAFSARQQGNRLLLNFELRNNGNSHLLPFGAVLLKQQGKVMRQREVVFDQPLFRDRTLSKQAEMDLGGLGPGHYQAQLDLFLNDGFNQDFAQAGLPLVSKTCEVTIEKP